MALYLLVYNAVLIFIQITAVDFEPTGNPNDFLSPQVCCAPFCPIFDYFWPFLRRHTPNMKENVSYCLQWSDIFVYK